MTPTDLAQAQLDAYNARDLDAFVACYAPDVEIYRLPDPAPTLVGHEAMRARYGPMFEAHPDLHCTLVHRMERGAFVIDEEHVAGLGDEIVHAIAIYEIAASDGAGDAGAGNLIRRVWFTG